MTTDVRVLREDFSKLLIGGTAVFTLFAEFVFGIDLVRRYFLEKMPEGINPNLITLAMLVVICFLFSQALVLSYGTGRPARTLEFQAFQIILGCLMILFLWLHFLGYTGLFLLTSQRFILTYHSAQFTRYVVMLCMSGGTALLGFVMGRVLQIALKGMDPFVEAVLQASLQGSTVVYIITAVAQIGMWLYRNANGLEMGFDFSIILALSLFVVNAGLGLFLSNQTAP